MDFASFLCEIENILEIQTGVLTDGEFLAVTEEWDY
jgi:hypothetical protein